MKWHIQETVQSVDKSQRVEEILSILLKNRGLKGEGEINNFLNPPDPLQLSLKDVAIDETFLKKTVTRLKKAIAHSEKILIFGDYDADGVTATAILWEALVSLGAKAIPFVPHRERHGYGLSVKALEQAFQKNQPSLVITVDNGITAVAAATWLAEKNIDLLITDHHQKPPVLPKAYAILHTDKISGAGISWFLARELNPESAAQSLDLVTIGSIADQMPMVGPNRALVKHGLKVVRHSPRPGINALFAESKIDPEEELSMYHVNFIIAPRINATGRLDDAMDSLRLLCTKNKQRAEALADTLGNVNRVRQDLTGTYIEKAIQLVGVPTDPILIVDDPEFHEGIVGLVAGKLVEKFSRPAIVIVRGEEISKASARSIPGVNIIALLREHADFLLGVGGHPMAAGLSLKTSQIDAFRAAIVSKAKQTITEDMLENALTIDCELALEDVSDELYTIIEKLKPFGLANPEPVFSFTKTTITGTKFVGKTANHLQITFKDSIGRILKGIRFNCGGQPTENIAAVASTIQKNRWNGREYLQLLIKDCL